MDFHEVCTVEGLCLEMCPKTERLERERNRRLSIFEIVRGTENSQKPKANPQTCVKEYSRSAAGREIDPADLRPPAVLLSTIDFMVNEIVDRGKHSRTWLEVYNFVSDRIRAVVQDMTIQRADANASIKLLQKAVRFHILFMYMLQNNNDFDKKLCFEQLCAYLASLLSYNKDRTTYDDILDEFYGYHLLVHFNTEQSLQYILSENKLSRNHNMIKLSLSNCRNNYVSLFRIAVKLPFIASCCFSQHINTLRLNALKTISIAYSGKNIQFPVATLADWLKFDSKKNATDFCEQLGLTVKDGFLTFKKNFIFTSDCLKNVSEEFDRSFCLVERKKSFSFNEYIHHGESWLDIVDF